MLHVLQVEWSSHTVSVRTAQVSTGLPETAHAPLPPKTVLEDCLNCELLFFKKKKMTSSFCVLTVIVHWVSSLSKYLVRMKRCGFQAGHWWREGTVTPGKRPHDDLENTEEIRHKDTRPRVRVTSG